MSNVSGKVSYVQNICYYSQRESQKAEEVIKYNKE
jgi:hypothetical protein